MKVTINIDCTPDEARTFFGLPDVKPMQAAMMQQLEERMTNALSAMEPEALMKTWLPVGLHNMEQFQKLFWSQMSAGLGGGDKPVK